MEGVDKAALRHTVCRGTVNWVTLRHRVIPEATRGEPVLNMGRVHLTLRNGSEVGFTRQGDFWRGNQGEPQRSEGVSGFGTGDGQQLGLELVCR